MTTTFDQMKYLEAVRAERHDDAIAYVDRFRSEDPANEKLRRFAALARGSKGEHILRSCDALGVAPSPQRLKQMSDLFEDAIEIDPTLPDPYWDLAVIHGRFLNRPETARRYLTQAKERGYGHPMMSSLENLICKGQTT